MKIVALKINSWDEKKTLKRKKSSESKYDREKTSDAFLYSWYLRKKKIESKWTMLFCCKLALAEKKIPKVKKGQNWD